MIPMPRALAWIAVLVIGTAATASHAQDAERRGRGPTERFRPEAQTERVMDRLAGRFLWQLSRDYDLTDEQRERVREELAAMRAEQEAFSAPLQEERDALREEMRELFRARRDGQEVDTERMREIGERMREMRGGAPLMNPANVIERVESLLPPEQVERGRERLEERRNEMLRGERQWGGGAWGFGDDPDRRREWQARRGAAGGDFWDRYTERFIEDHGLDASQQSSARSLLRDMKQQRDRYRENRREDFGAVRDISDREERTARQRELNEPLERMFTQLQERLRQIPTAAQREAAQAAGAPTTRPAFGGGRPRGEDRGGDAATEGDRGTERRERGNRAGRGDTERQGGERGERAERRGRGGDRGGRGDR